MTSRIVVLGANGFIGRRVVAALQASGWASPIAATRRHVAFPDTIEQVQIDATDEIAVTRVLQNATGIVNCVAGDATTIAANARALYSAAARCTPRPRVVYLSSMAVYGSTNGTVSESATLTGDWGAYGAAKIAAERIGASYPDAVILRPGIVYGPRSDWWSVQIGRLLRERRLGDLGADGEGTCNLLYVEDLAQAVVQVLRLQQASRHVLNLAMSGAPSWNEYFARYACALGATRPASISATRLAMELHVLGPILKLLELGGTVTPFKPPPPIRPWLIRLTRHRIRLDVSAAERLLGTGWTPIEEALKTTASWFLVSSHAGCKVPAANA